MLPDKRALKILFDTYWTSSGWRAAGNLNWTPSTPDDDFAFAARAGVMFPPRKLGHDDALQRIGELRVSINPRAVGTVFIDSLSSGAVGLRSALGSYAVAMHMPLHRFAASAGTRRCAICGAYDSRTEHDVNILNFERHKWGGVRHEQPIYIVFDLERFAAEAVNGPVSPNREPFARLLDAIDSMTSGAKLSDLVRVLKPIVSGNEPQLEPSSHYWVTLVSSGSHLAPDSSNRSQPRAIARRHPGTKTTGRIPPAGGVGGSASIET